MTVATLDLAGIEPVVRKGFLPAPGKVQWCLDALKWRGWEESLRSEVSNTLQQMQAAFPECWFAVDVDLDEDTADVVPILKVMGPGTMSERVDKITSAYLGGLLTHSDRLIVIAG